MLSDDQREQVYFESQYDQHTAAYKDWLRRQPTEWVLGLFNSIQEMAESKDPAMYGVGMLAVFGLHNLDFETPWE